MAQRSTAPARRAGPPLPVAVTLGDPAGIGPDITLQGWRLREAHALPPFAVYGDADVLRDRARTLGLDAPIVSVDRLAEAAAFFPEALPVVRSGTRSGPHSARTAGLDRTDANIVATIENATAAALNGAALALLTN